MKKTKELKTKAEYTKALARFEKIFHAPIGTKESDEADYLSILLKNYEDKHFIIDKPNMGDIVKNILNTPIELGFRKIFKK